MNKILILIVSAFILVVTLNLVTSYTAPNYSNITLVLDSGYSAPSYSNITLILEEDAVVTNSCTAPSINTNWVISLNDYCVITTAVNIGTGNITFTGVGNVTLNASVIAYNIGDLPDNQKGFIGINGRINIG